MSLAPTFNIKISNSCTKIEPEDTIGRYDAANNPNGWGAPNDDYSDITDAVINIYDLDEALLETYIVKQGATDQYPASAPYPQTIPFAEADWVNPDGVYKFDYVITGSETVSSGIVPKLICCNLAQCIALQENKALKECNEEIRMKLLNRADELRMILRGIQSTFVCGNFADAQAAIEDATKLCAAYDNCEC